MVLVGAAFIGGALLSNRSLGLSGPGMPRVFLLVLGIAVIKVGMRPNDLPDEPDNSELGSLTGT